MLLYILDKHFNDDFIIDRPPVSLAPGNNGADMCFLNTLQFVPMFACILHTRLLGVLSLCCKSRGIFSYILRQRAISFSSASKLFFKIMKINLLLFFQIQTDKRFEYNFLGDYIFGKIQVVLLPRE